MDAFLQFSLQKKDFILFLFFLVQEAFLASRKFLFLFNLFLFFCAGQRREAHLPNIRGG